MVCTYFSMNEMNHSEVMPAKPVRKLSYTTSLTLPILDTAVLWASKSGNGTGTVQYLWSRTTVPLQVRFEALVFGTSVAF